MKYKGTYRLMANLDHDTNDFPRDDKGNLDTDDICIKCQYGNQIYYYGRNDLVAYIPSLGRGHNILRAIAADRLQIEDKIPYEELYPKLLSEGTVKHIMENDEEIEFHFHPRDISYIATLLKASTHGADISPFSTRNLPKQKYEIPESDLEQYKQVVKDVPKDKFLIISRATSNYIFERMQKMKQYKSEPIKKLMRKKMLKGKEFIHSEEQWDDFLKYLSKEVSICLT